MTRYTKIFDPELLLFPIPENHLEPFLSIVGTTAIVSTLFTVVGFPKSPTLAGKGASVEVDLFYPQGFQLMLFLLHKHMHLNQDVNIGQNQYLTQIYFFLEFFKLH